VLSPSHIRLGKSVSKRDREGIHRKPHTDKYIVKEE